MLSPRNMSLWHEIKIGLKQKTQTEYVQQGSGKEDNRRICFCIDTVCFPSSLQTLPFSRLPERSLSFLSSKTHLQCHFSYATPRGDGRSQCRLGNSLLPMNSHVTYGQLSFLEQIAIITDSPEKKDKFASDESLLNLGMFIQHFTALLLSVEYLGHEGFFVECFYSFKEGSLLGRPGYILHVLTLLSGVVGNSLSLHPSHKLLKFLVAYVCGLCMCAWTWPQHIEVVG